MLGINSTNYENNVIFYKNNLFVGLEKNIRAYMLYRTVFGAVWVYFGKEPSTIEVINDIDKELINLFKMIKYHSPEIERLLGYEFSRRDIFEEYKNYNINYLTEIHRAIRFLYLITQSFVGKGKTYGYGTTTKPSQKVFYKNMLSDIRERLSNTYVENLSFEKIIDKYDRDIAFSFVILRILKLQDMIISLEKKNISF